MFKRVTIVALVVAAFLVLAVPALAFNGFRANYTMTGACASCHTAGSFGAPIVMPSFVKTAHYLNPEGPSALQEIPRGSTCAGCHSGNYAPAKVVPIANPDYDPADEESEPFIASNGLPTGTQQGGNSAASETFIGCSSCHYGVSAGVSPLDGQDTNDTAHKAPYAEMANADICGACHSRYSYAKNPIYVQATADETPPVLLQPQMAIGYPMLGAPAASPATGWVPAAPLSDYLVTPKSGWTPSPNPAATSASALQTYWKYDENGDEILQASETTVWQQKGHVGSAAQYPEWANEGHANALTALKAVMGPNPPATCLECHSADYRIAEEAGKTPPTGAQAKYGITCVGCHTPHNAGTETGVWDEELEPQLIGDTLDLCTDCHNGEIPEGETVTPGTEIHHPMKEMMDGYGAIDVSAFPSVHKGKCVQCHMPPTSYGRNVPQLGGNHTFQIIEPEVAAGVETIVVGGEDVVMPYSSCSTCHGRGTDPLATYLQDTITQRQDWTMAKVDEIWAVLDAVAVDNKYADAAAARDALVEVPENKWTTSQRAFLSAFTNVEFVESEGSYGLHNWDYSREIVNTAMMQAKIAQSGVIVRTPWDVTLKMSKANVRAGTTVKFTGTVKTKRGVAGAGTVRIMRRISGTWQVWLKGRLNSSGKYSISQKLTRTGTFRIRAFMPANSTNLSAYSPSSLKLVVRR
jgi:hypothetical protein